jgi:pyroglutamyl-peptidase
MRPPSMPSESPKQPIRTVLVTGFEPYGGRAINPAAEVATALDGVEIHGTRIHGATLPVVLDRIEDALNRSVSETSPDLLLCLGLFPGEAAIRLERYAVNIADFEIADNAGARLSEMPLAAGGSEALRTSLPLKAIETALLEDGIPAFISNSAGTFLCNAALYHGLEIAARSEQGMRCGFMHLPYLPAQAALLMQDRKRLKNGQETTPAGAPPSMALATMQAAVRTVIRTCIATA